MINIVSILKKNFIKCTLKNKLIVLTMFVCFCTTLLLSLSFIVIDLANWQQHIFKYATIVTFVIVATMSVALILVNWLHHYITDPIENLVGTAKKISKSGNYILRAKQYYDDEIGHLTKTFNQIMDEIEEAKQSLEIKVGHRTKELETEKLKAETALESKSEFLRNMSHEFRTPLHAINSFSLYGIKECDTATRETLSRYFNRINSSSEKLLNLVNSVLCLSRLESGKETLEIKHGNLYKITSEVTKEFSALAKDKKIKINLTKPNFSTEAYFDANKIWQVITNILGNAIKFTPKNKEIDINFAKTSTTSKYGKNIKSDAISISISISDQGVGIPEAELSCIFGNFVQSSRTKTDAGGTGLGLAIAKKIVDNHMGKIKAENNDEGGATFTITIPTNLNEGNYIITTIAQDVIRV